MTKWLLTAAALVGLVCLVVVHSGWIDGWPLLIRELVAEVGRAGIVAAILGTIVDEALKRDLVRDAVSATLGYLLAPALKAKLGWVYGQRFVATQTFAVRLEHEPDNGLVRFHGLVTRDIRNVS